MAQQMVWVSTAAALSPPPLCQAHLAGTGHPGSNSSTDGFALSPGAAYQQQQQQPGGGMLPPAALQPFLALCSDYLQLGQQSLGQPAVQFSQPQPVLMPMMPHNPTNLFSKQPLAQNASQHSTLFFAGVTPVAEWPQVRQLFSNYGAVVDLNLFRPYNGCRTSKGCGLVVFSQHAEAAAALQALNGRFVWPGARSPMVIEWCDPSKQHKKKRAQPLAHTLMQHPAAQVQHLTHVRYTQQPLLSQHLQQQPQQQLPAPQLQHVQHPYAMNVLSGAAPLFTQGAGLQVRYANQSVYS